jgi:hypothetical protein
MADSIKSEQLLDQCVMEGMFYDIQKVLGMALFHEIVEEYDANNLSTENKLLMNGGAYTWCEKTLAFQGLKACLAYYAFARYTKRTGVHYTATGIVEKTSDFSDPVSDKTRTRLAGDDFAIAEALKIEIVEFLNRNFEDYPLWNCKRKKKTPTFRTIGT